MGQPTAPDESYKIGRVLAAYGLEDLHERLPALWRGDTGEATSLRDLARQINIAILQRAMERAGLDPIDGEAANAYRLLTDDEVSAGARTQQRRSLERAGIEVDQLEGQFVTHQAIYTYLTEVLGVSKDTDTDPVESRRERVQRLRGRTEAVVGDALTTLRDSSSITLGESETTVDIRVYCRNCQSGYEFEDLLARGGCACDE